jgi:hypothetical protein
VDKARALATWKAAYPDDTSSERWIELMVFTGQWQALKDGLTAPTTDQGRGAALAADQLLSSAPEAWKRWSTRLERTAAQAAANQAVLIHLQGGRPEAARELMRAAGLERLADFERLTKPAAPASTLGPEQALVRGLFEAALSGDAARAERFARESMVAVAGSLSPSEFMAAFAKGMAIFTKSARLPRELLLVMLTHAQVDLTPNGRDAARATLTYAPGKSQQLFLARQAGQWKLLVFVTAAEVAGMAVERFEAGKADEGATWLGWARAMQTPNAGSPGEVTDEEAVARASPDDPRLQAAALSPSRPASRALLAAALAKADPSTAAPLARLVVRGALAAEAWAEARTRAEALNRLVPDDDRSAWLRLLALAKAGDSAAREAANDAWLKRRPGALLPMRDNASAAASRGDLQLAARRMAEVVALPTATPMDFNNAAWFALMSGDDGPRTLELARKSVAGKDPSPSAQHTLAAVLVSRGGDDLHEATGLIRQLGSAAPRPALWLLPARLADRLGLVEEARALYRKALEPKGAPDSSGALAARWLQALEAGRDADGQR